MPAAADVSEDSVSNQRAEIGEDRLGAAMSVNAGVVWRVFWEAEKDEVDGWKVELRTFSSTTLIGMSEQGVDTEAADVWNDPVSDKRVEVGEDRLGTEMPAAEDFA
jgi:hypothetical protein